MAEELFNPLRAIKEEGICLEGDYYLLRRGNYILKAFGGEGPLAKTRTLFEVGENDTEPSMVLKHLKPHGEISLAIRPPSLREQKGFLLYYYNPASGSLEIKKDQGQQAIGLDYKTQYLMADVLALIEEVVRHPNVTIMYLQLDASGGIILPGKINLNPREGK